MAASNLTITEQQKKILIPALVGAILLGAFGYVIYQTTNELTLLKRQISDAKRKAKAISELQQLKAKEEVLLKAFPSSNDKNDIIKEIAGWGRKEGLDVTDIEPTENPLAGTGFVQLKFTMTGRGSYLPIMRFLKRVESSSYFVLASGLTLQGFDLSKSRNFSKGKELQNSTDGPFRITINVFMLE